MQIDGNQSRAGQHQSTVARQRQILHLWTVERIKAASLCTGDQILQDIELLHHLSIVLCSAPSVPQPVFTITEKAPTRAFSWLKAPTRAFTFKTLLRHYAKQALTPQSLNVKLGPRRNYHKGWAAIRHYANQPTHLI